MSRKIKTYLFLPVLLVLGSPSFAQPILSTDPEPTYLVEARARNGGTGFEGVVFTPGDPSPGTGATQLNPVGIPVGIPAWSYGQNHLFEFRFTAATGTCVWNIDFNRDGDFLDSEESAISVSPSLVDRSFTYVNIWLQGFPGGITITVNNFTLNGVNFGSFSATGGSPTSQLFEETSGNFNDILATGTVNISGGASSERPRLWIRLGELVILPNQLIDFTLKKNGIEQFLEWTTANEFFTKEFQVERSADGIQFQSIGSVRAKNIPGINKYQFNDRSPLNSIAFYRLKTIDLDGRYTVSSLLRANERSNFNVLQIYPNPSKGSFSIILPDDSPANIRMVNLNGKTILEKSTKSQAINFNLWHTPPGLYFITILQNGQTTTERLLIQ